MMIRRFLKQFNPRFFVVRLLVNAIAVAITAAVTPKIYFVDKSVWSWLLIAAMLGVLNAVLKPVLQFLTLQFLFVTYGLVIVLINTLILLLLSFLFPARFAVDNVWWALVGGLVLGLLSSFLESLLGLTMPIVPDEPPELRKQVEEQARQVGWLATAGQEAVAREQALATAPPALEVTAAEPAEAEQPTMVGIDASELDAAEAAVVEADAAATAVAEPAGAEAPTPGPDQGEPPPAGFEPEPSDSEAALPAEAAIPGGSEPAPEPQEEEKEDES
jgi:putative membrane protein